MANIRSSPDNSGSERASKKPRLDTKLRLYCLVEGDRGSFDVEMDLNADVAVLMRAIKESKGSGFSDVFPQDLRVWKIDKPPRDAIKLTQGNMEDDCEMFASETISSHWDTVGKGHVHVFVARPLAPISASRSEPDIFGLYPRQDTVAAIWEKLREYRFIWARGTPKSGKTSLANLLASYAQQQLPSASVIMVPPCQATEATLINCSWEWEYVLWKMGWNRNIETILIFDEGQKTYIDQDLWVQLFKDIHMYGKVYVIGFASYGSALAYFRVADRINPIIIPPRQRITLRAIDHGDECRAAGLLFDRAEFDDWMESTLWDDSFLDRFFELTGGHIGAMCDVTNVITEFREVTREGRRFGWDTFEANFPPNRLMQALRGSRGLPLDDELHDVDTAQTLSVVAQKSHVLETDIPPNLRGCVRACVERGWLHCDGNDTNGQVCYFFASKLYQWYVQWKLFLDGTFAGIIKEDTAIEFVSNVIGRFDPHALRKRETSPGVQETRYQDEFYRCSHAHVGGSVVASLDCGTSRDRVDFYAKSKQWGIEVLCDSGEDGLEERVERFSQYGEYINLPVSDYIVLDCRATRPVEAHPGLDKLYHVVFAEDCGSVEILDHNLERYRIISFTNY